MRDVPLTTFTERAKQMYGWGGGWDRVRKQSECLHCHGTGRCDENNECGFCEPD